MINIKFMFLIISIWIPKMYFAEVIVSDIVLPREFCSDQEECKSIGCSGHLDCVNSICSCVNDSKYIKDNSNYLHGCYLNKTFGNPCRFNKDCIEDGTICTSRSLTCIESNEKRISTCQCRGNKEYINGKCVDVLDRKHGSKCCTDTHCDANYYCHLNDNYPYGHCKCKDGFVLFKDECISMAESVICTKDSDCTDGYFCIKEQTQHGNCRQIEILTPKIGCKETLDCQKFNYYGHVECKNTWCTCMNGSTQVRFNNHEGCYYKSDFGQKCLYQHDCQNDLVCIQHENNVLGTCQCPEHLFYHKSKCIEIPRHEYGTICHDNTECNAEGLYCKRNNTNVLGQCKCDAEETIVYDGQCIELSLLGFCKTNEDCARNEFCNRKNYESLFGHCADIVAVETFFVGNDETKAKLKEEKVNVDFKFFTNKLIIIISFLLLIIIIVIIYILIREKKCVFPIFGTVLREHNQVNYNNLRSYSSTP